MEAAKREPIDELATAWSLAFDGVADELGY
jgi:hypothetical protein